jgi:hypothetical protein
MFPSYLACFAGRNTGHGKLTIFDCNAQCFTIPLFFCFSGSAGIDGYVKAKILSQGRSSLRNRTNHLDTFGMILGDVIHSVMPSHAVKSINFRKRHLISCEFALSAWGGLLASGVESQCSLYPSMPGPMNKA